MGIPYDFYENPVPKGSDRKPTLHARVKPVGTMKTSDMFELIQRFTSLSTADAKAALDAFISVMKMGLSGGKVVHIEGLGCFQLTLDNLPADTPAEHRAESIKVRSVAFRPDAKLLNAFCSVKVERVREKNHSCGCPAEKVDALLDTFFQSHATLTRRQFCRLCGFTRSTGMRRINQLIAEGKLRKVSYGNGAYEKV